MTTYSSDKRRDNLVDRIGMVSLDAEHGPHGVLERALVHLSTEELLDELEKSYVVVCYTGRCDGWRRLSQFQCRQWNFEVRLRERQDTRASELASRSLQCRQSRVQHLENIDINISFFGVASQVRASRRTCTNRRTQ
jgi:hypothetical protein